MTTEQLIESIVDYQITLEDKVIEEMPNIQKRMRDLLDNPGKRNRGIVKDFLEFEIGETLKETGDLAYAESYWGQVADRLELSWAELNSIPLARRGDFHDTTKNMLVGIVRKQAETEMGLTSSSIKTGNEFAKDKEQDLKGVDIEELASKMDLKNQIRDKRLGIQ